MAAKQSNKLYFGMPSPEVDVADVDNDDDSVDDDDDGAYDDDDDELKKNSLDDDVIAIELGDIDVFHSPVFTSSIFISCSVDVT